MSSAKLSAPVGLSPRHSSGDEVKNKPADVLLVRQMLEANKIGPLGTSKKMDAGLLKAIAAFQKKAGFKHPDKVVDPGGRTFKMLLPGYKKQLAEEAKAAKEPMVEVNFRGKKILCTPKEFESVKADVIKRLTPYMKSLLRNHDNALETYRHYLDVAQMKDGVLDAVAQAIILQAGSVEMPKNKLCLRSISASGKLERAMVSKDLKLINEALPEAEKAIGAFNADLLRFLKEFTGSAQTTATVLTVSSAACFAVVGALAAPVLVTGAGMSAGSAAIASGAGVGVLQSASQELGKHASGQKVTVWGSIQSIVIDGTVGGLTGGIGSKIPLGFCDDAAKWVAPKLAGKVAFLSTKQMQKFIANYLAGSGQEVIKTVLGEAVKELGRIMKSGKAPTEKEFQAIVTSILYSALLGGLVKNLGGFQKKWAYKNKEVLQGKIFPDRLAKIAKTNDIPNTLKAKLWAEVMNKVSDESLKVGYGAIISRATGKESEAQMTDMAAKAAAKDKALMSLVDKELTKALKKHKVPVK
ncbi:MULTISPECIES: hypothetical protein [Bacteria]|uniref:hypothetical protein n=1 Tax=Bacteria TaxID=2 RepID=UPI001EF5A923|nr:MULTISPECIES: hypothetical protein [Bacteria]MCG7625256.1 hypothetical protein [Epibacterium sp. Ofav1-8]MEB3885767.1 hypothetical protein [Lyngbya sp. CCY1209]